MTKKSIRKWSQSTVSVHLAIHPMEKLKDRVTRYKWLSWKPASALKTVSLVRRHAPGPPNFPCPGQSLHLQSCPWAPRATPSCSSPDRRSSFTSSGPLQPLPPWNSHTLGLGHSPVTTVFPSEPLAEITGSLLPVFHLCPHTRILAHGYWNSKTFLL